MSNLLLSQVVAAIALTCGVVSFQFRDRRSILLWLSGYAFLNACHFFILGTAAPGILFLIIGARSLTSAFIINRKMMVVFIGLILVAFFCTYERPLGFLGLFGTLLATYGSFQRTEQRVRLLHMVSNTFWMVHNILVMTPVGVVIEATFLGSNALGYWRFRRTAKAAAGRKLDAGPERTG